LKEVERALAYPLKPKALEIFSGLSREKRQNLKGKFQMDSQTVFDKVQALLAKAARSEFPEEAKAFYAKAHSMMLQHAITEQQLREAGRLQEEMPVVIVWKYGGNLKEHVQSARHLASVVASSNRCRVVFHTLEGTASIVGFERDIAFVKVLYSSLWVKAFVDSVRGIQGRKTQAKLDSFMNGFADEIARRFKESEEETIKQAAPGSGLALRNVEDIVKEVLQKEFPHLGFIRFNRPDSSSYNAGQRSGKTADLSGGRHTLNQQSNKALGR
jgi:Protein of unknown function (DUF2786)